MRAIAAQTQTGRVSVLARPSCRAKDLLSGEPCVEEVIEYDYRSRVSDGRKLEHAGIAGMVRMAAKLRSRQFSHVFIFSSRVRYALMALAANIPHRGGFGFGIVERVVLNMPPYIERFRGPGSWVYPEATAFAIAQKFVSKPLVPRLTVPDLELESARRELHSLPVARVALAIGTSEPRKDWGDANFGQLAGMLVAQGFAVVVLGGPAETERARRVAELAGASAAVRTVCQPSVLRSAAVLKTCRLCVGNDTGILNVAAAVEVPSLGLFGVTKPLMHDPLLSGIEGNGMGTIAPEVVLAETHRLLTLHACDGEPAEPRAKVG